MAKKKATRKLKIEKDADVLAVLWHALDRVAGKEATSASRARLAAGAAHEIDLKVAGTIDGQQLLAEAITGQLRIGHDTPSNASVNPDYVGLVALLLEELPVKRRLEIRHNWPEHFTREGQLPAVSEALRIQADDLLEALRSRKPITRRGSVSFVRTARQEAAQV